jgi:STE24 endopeptidase
LRDAAERVFERRFLQVLLFIAMLSVVLWLMNLPWDLYVGFIREHQYGLSNQTVGSWFGDSLKGLLPTLLLFSPVGALLYLGIRRSPRHWWLAASVATPFLLVLLLIIAPVFIAPLFNTYQPLTDARVRDPILSMARANGVPVDNVYQFDASKQTTRISANVSGAFRTIRVSLNDNLLNRCSPAEVQAVTAHELGHYVLNHVYKLTIYVSLVIMVGLAFTHWFFGAVTRRWGAGWGLRGIDDLAGLPLLLAGLGIFLLLAAPVENTIIRTTESEADIFGLNVARQPDAFATVALKLAEYRKLAPGQWEELVFFDHPSGHDRILMAMRWKAEHLAESAPPEKP